MTVKQIKAKNCLGKQCNYMVKNENHDYWRQREQVKQLRQARKQAINEYVNKFALGESV
jgi:predicted phosphohydrolase